MEVRAIRRRHLPRDIRQPRLADPRVPEVVQRRRRVDVQEAVVRDVAHRRRIVHDAVLPAQPAVLPTQSERDEVLERGACGEHRAGEALDLLQRVLVVVGADGEPVGIFLAGREVLIRL